MIALILDNETTDLIDNHLVALDKQPEIIEFAAVLVDLDTGEQSRQFSQLIKPMRPVPQKITGITGLTDADLATAPSFRAVSSVIEDLITNAPMIIAHNASFDQEMIDLEFERLGRSLKWPMILCTVEQTVHLKGFRLSQSALHEHLFNEPIKEAHRAAADVQSLTRCVLELRKRGEI